MTQFQYWYTYFDSIFLKKEPSANRTLALMIGSDVQEWPKTSPLPQLLTCFEQLQSFILNQKNWSESICTIDELNKIQADVTNVLVLLEIQKIYMKEFWLNRRRVEASVTHLYAILQIFVSSIIPYNTMTLFQCKAANKLCVRIANLQNLFKSIMKKINQICAFFSHQYFTQQNQILRNFFQNFVAFMKSIPKIKKARMFHISELLKYIMIMNTLEITSNLKPKIQKPKSKHNSKILQQEIRQEMIVKSCEKPTKKVGNFYGLYFKNRKKQNSCPHKQNFDNKSIDYISRAKNSLRFIFPNWIRRHSIKHRKQTVPKLHIQSYMTKGKSNTQGLLKEKESQEMKSSAKMRIKSATKIRTKKSPSLLQPPSAMPRFTKQISSTQKFSLYDHPFEEDEQNCIQKIESQRKLKYEQRRSCINTLIESEPKILCVQTMDIQQDKRIESLMKEFMVMKEIQKILELAPIKAKVHQPKHLLF